MAVKQYLDQAGLKAFWKAVKGKIDAVDGRTINSKPISGNPILTGDDINLGTVFTDFPSVSKDEKLYEPQVSSAGDLGKGYTRQKDQSLSTNIGYLAENDKILGKGITSALKNIKTINDSLGTHTETVPPRTVWGEIESLKGSITGGTHFIGTTTGELSTTSIVTDQYPGGYTPINGNFVIKGNKEYIFSKPDEKSGTWVELGDTTAERTDIDNIVNGTKTVKNATNATTAEKLGSATIGGEDEPIYLNNGAPTAGSKWEAITDAWIIGLVDAKNIDSYTGPTPTV